MPTEDRPGAAATTPAVSWPIARDPATGAALACPPTWERVDAALTAISVAAPVAMVEPGQFRPNVTLTVERVPPGQRI